MGTRGKAGLIRRATNSSFPPPERRKPVIPNAKNIGELNTAVDRLFHVVEHFPGKKLLFMFKRIACDFKVDWFIGYDDLKPFDHYTFAMFCVQIDKIQQVVSTHCDSAIDDAAAYFDLSADEYDESLF